MIFLLTNSYVDTPSKKVQNLGIWSLKEGEGYFRNLIFHTFNLGHFREEGGGSKPEFPIFKDNIIEKIP